MRVWEVRDLRGALSARNPERKGMGGVLSWLWGAFGDGGALKERSIVLLGACSGRSALAQASPALTVAARPRRAGQRGQDDAAVAPDDERVPHNGAHHGAGAALAATWRRALTRGGQAPYPDDFVLDGIHFRAFDLGGHEVGRLAAAALASRWS